MAKTILAFIALGCPSNVLAIDYAKKKGRSRIERIDEDKSTEIPFGGWFFISNFISASTQGSPGPSTHLKPTVNFFMNIEIYRAPFLPFEI
jgi:hypothetical protein